MHSKSDNMNLLNYNKSNEDAVELFKSVLSRYQHNLGRSKRKSDFIFDSGHLMHYKDTVGHILIVHIG